MSPETLLVFLFFVLGLAFGSFGNVLVCRLPEGKKITGRSVCTQCGQSIGWIDLVPLVSYLCLRGRCRHCDSGIAMHYCVVELLSGVIFAATAVLLPLPSPLHVLLVSLALWILLLIALIDARTRSIPDALSVPLVLVAGAFALSMRSTDALVAAGVGLGFFALQWGVSRGTWVGSGDLIVITGIGLLLPDYLSMVALIMTAYIVGAVYALWLLATKRATKQSHIAFAPFLVIATYIVLFGEDLLPLSFFLP